MKRIQELISDIENDEGHDPVDFNTVLVALGGDPICNIDTGPFKATTYALLLIARSVEAIKDD